jgi:D-inositol-3-phosphate glycosyltransferase
VSRFERGERVPGARPRGLGVPAGRVIGPATRRGAPRRIATLSVHTSPLDQPGTGDAGGMNVYIVELSKRLAALGIEVEIFTRATSSDLPPQVELAPGVLVRHVTAGPFEGLSKEDLPGQLCAFTAGVLRAEAMREPGYYDLVHSHYWLSGQVGWLVKDRWGVPLVHTMHTMAKVKNAALARGDAREPTARVIGEAQVIEAADLLVTNTEAEAAQLVQLYGAAEHRVATVTPGVDLDTFSPGDAAAARARVGVPADAVMLLFVGRIQPLKAPDVLLRAAAGLLEADPALRRRLVVAVVGGPSGTGLAEPEHLHKLAGSLGISDVVRFAKPVPQEALADWYRAATVTVVPSYSESFGLVAVESQACGTPVVAAAVGGLRTAVRDGVSGILVDGHDPADYATALRTVLASPGTHARFSAAAVQHAGQFGWSAAAATLLDLYADAGAALRADREPLAVGR